MTVSTAPRAAAAAPVRILLAEANPFVVSALTSCFDGDDRFRLVGSVDRGDAVLAINPDTVDVVVLAWQLADMLAPDVLRAIKARGSSLPVTVFSNSRDLGHVRLSVRLGALGFCYQFDEPSVLFDTLHAVANGRICVPFIDVTKINETPLAQLTVRERELLSVLARGWTNQQIANRTGISENTVKYHLKNLYDKLGVHNRAMAVAVFSREAAD